MRQDLTNIRILAAPPGEAPDEIREAWIGMVLPVVPGHLRPIRGQQFGVVTGPKTPLMLRVATFLRLGRSVSATYHVDAKTALRLLADHAPLAEAWWRSNTPHLYREGMVLGFAEYVCEVVAE
jgi:hypothetical protein